jgi:hypothetical protein
MGTKGINPLERHCEKIVLGVTLILLVGVGTMQFIGQPNAVEVGGNLTPPGDVSRMLARRAEELERATHSPDVVDLPEVRSLDQLFESRRDLGDAVARAPVPWGPRYDIEIDAGGTPVEDIFYAEVELAPAEEPLVVADFYNLDPLVLEEAQPNDEILAWFGGNQPADFRAVTIESRVDPATVRAAFEVDGDDPSIRSIPAGWYEDRAYIADVVVERERLLDDGTWGETTEVAPMPGRASVRDLLRRDTPVAFNDLRTARDEAAWDIEQPPFYRTSTNEWERPSVVLAADKSAGAAESPLDREERRLEDIRDRIANLERQVQRLEDRIDRTPGGTGRDRNPAVDRLREQLSNLNADLREEQDQEREQIRQIEALATTLGVTWEDPTQARRTTQRERREEIEEPEVFQNLSTLLERDDVPLWTTDIDVQPGATYRYRMRYDILNPFAGKANRLNATQKPLAEPLVVASPWSDWSEPVEVPDSTYFFVVNANPAQAGTPVARAGIELYRYYDGYWRRSDASVEPGDVVARSLTITRDVVEVDRPTGPRPGGREGEEGGRSTVTTTEQAVTERIVLEAPYTFLDVVERPTRATTTISAAAIEERIYQAVMSDEEGRIVVRQPSQDSANPLRARLERLVEQAERLLAAD